MTSPGPGAVLAERYRLDREVGRGGMGVVWASTRLADGAAVALKLVHAPSPDLRRRLIQEAEVAMALRHPHVVAALDAFELYETDGSATPVLVMDLLHGETLGDRLAREERVALPEFAPLLLQAVSAVGAAHALGIVHRDLKPENLFLGEDGRLSVLDFGVAKVIAPFHGLVSMYTTKPGARVGTPRYMAPEQALLDRAIDHRADVWALGVIAYECLSGIPPIDGLTVTEVLRNLTRSVVTPLEHVVFELPEDVTSLVGRMLSRAPEARPSLHETSDVLRRHAEVKVPGFDDPRAASADR